MPKVIGRSPPPPLANTTPATQAPAAPGAPAADPAGWKKFQTNFQARPATELEALRARAVAIGRPDVVAPLTGLQLADNSHHSVASNTMRNYPIKDIYAELYSAPPEPPGWQKFQDDFYKAPATQVEVLRARAAALGRPEVAAPLTGLQLADNSHHSVASNTMRNYPIKEIYAELFSAPPEPPGWDKFQDEFYKAPATQLEVLRTRAAELGKPEVVAPFTGLQLQDGGHHSVASNTMRNYPVKEAYAALFGG